MKCKYSEKIKRMRKSSASRKIATHFAENEGKVITNSEVMELTGLDKTQSRNAVSTLIASGWVIENTARHGHDAKWMLRDVKERKGGVKKIVKPYLHPLIESVFC